ncbi:hypothetical protein BG262_05475 [Floricoccus penangensis]|uniref:Uncharacterized protein n=1 Tax=Floricoccus penangensis TaxID=1859475 RepID=A0A9Q5JFT9_9LACT|nr:hypothetical protein [Floricoccus penangensis]OFI46466.1 hypothetical protein BG262_05475 [Floricoccus penangensis]
MYSINQFQSYIDHKNSVNKIIKNMKLGKTEEYITSNLGAPISSWNEKIDDTVLKQNIYEINDIYFKASFDKNSSVGYFFYNLFDNDFINLSIFSVSNIALGKDNYDDLNKEKQPYTFSNRDIKFCNNIQIQQGNKPYDIYYSEWYYWGNLASYNTIVYGNFSKINKNFNNSNSLKIKQPKFLTNTYYNLLVPNSFQKSLENKFTNEDYIENELIFDMNKSYNNNCENGKCIIKEKAKISEILNITNTNYKKAKPNVYGLIAPGYEDKVSITSIDRKNNMFFNYLYPN